MSAYAGFPASINAMDELKSVLKELSELDSNQIELLEKSYKDFSPDLIKFIICAQADIMARNNLNKRFRELSTISALAALGTARPQLKFHINAAINIGLTVDEIKEIMLLISVYSGFPNAINRTCVLKEVLVERNIKG